jgi:hypothetical protein
MLRGSRAGGLIQTHGQRFCDICDEEIPKGTEYQRNRMPGHAADLLRVGHDPDLVPTWTTNADGTISMDICVTCVLSMGVNPRESEAN